MSKTKIDLWYSLFSQFGFKLIGFGITAVLARHLSQEDFGRLTLALSLCTLCVMFTDLGYSTNLVRNISARPDTLRKQLGLFLSVQIPLIITFLVCTNVIVWLTKPDLLPAIIGISLSAACKSYYKSYAASLLAGRRIRRNILSLGSGLLFVLFGVSAADQLNLGLEWIVLIYALGGLLTLTVAAVQVKSLYGTIPVKVTHKRLKKYLFSAFFLFLLSALSYAHFSIDQIALGYLDTYKNVATFAAAAQLLEASQFAIRPLTLIMFPICALLNKNRAWEELFTTVRTMHIGAVFIGSCAFIFVLLFSNNIIAIVFSNTYSQSSVILKILYGSVPALFVTSVGLFVAASLSREKQCCIALSLAVGTKLSLYWFVVPEYGPEGVAWMNFFTQNLIACWLTLDTYKTIRLRKIQGATAHQAPMINRRLIPSILGRSPPASG